MSIDVGISATIFVNQPITGIRGNVERLFLPRHPIDHTYGFCRHVDARPGRCRPAAPSDPGIGGETESENRGTSLPQGASNEQKVYRAVIAGLAPAIQASTVPIANALREA